jgi:hypothetical protein
MFGGSGIAGPLPAVPVPFLRRVHRIGVPATRRGMTSGRSWRRAYGDVGHPLIVVSCFDKSLGYHTDDQQRDFSARWWFTQLNQATTTTDCCSFEMIRASFQQEWASEGFYVIHGHTRGTQSQRCTEQGLLISVRSGVNARAVAAAHQSSRSACQVSRSGLGRSALFAAPSLFTASNVVTLSTTGHRRIRPLVQRPAGAQSRMQPRSVCGCATSPRTALKAP